MSPCFFNAWWVRSFELSKVILQIVHLLLSNSSSKCLSEKKQKSIILILDWRLYNPGRFLGSGLEKYNDWKTERNNHSWAKFKIVLVRKLERKFYYFMAKFQGSGFSFQSLNQNIKVVLDLSIYSNNAHSQSDIYKSHFQMHIRS